MPKHCYHVKTGSECFVNRLLPESICPKVTFMKLYYDFVQVIFISKLICGSFLNFDSTAAIAGLTVYQKILNNNNNNNNI